MRPATWPPQEAFRGLVYRNLKDFEFGADAILSPQELDQVDDLLKTFGAEYRPGSRRR